MPAVMLVTSLVILTLWLLVPKEPRARLPRPGWQTEGELESRGQAKTTAIPVVFQPPPRRILPFPPPSPPRFGDKRIQACRYKTAKGNVFSTYELARSEAWKLTDQGQKAGRLGTGQRVWAFKCTECEWWHVGKNQRKDRRRAAGRQ